MDKYEEALKLARVYYSEDCNQFLDTIFPELSESEDERIRKSIADCVSCFGEDSDIFNKHKVTKVQVLAYLKKQKDAITDVTMTEAYKMGLEAGRAQEAAENFFDSAQSYHEGFVAGQKQKENPKSADSIPSDCVSNAKCEDRWHKVADSLPDNPREVLCRDSVGNYFIGRYYTGEGWMISNYDDEDKPHHLNPPVSKWIDFPSEKQKEQKEIPLMNGDADLYFDNWIQHNDTTKRGYFEEGIRYAQRLQKEQKPAEWSEEDERIKERLITRLNWITYNTRTDGTSPNITFFDEIEWLKSLRPQPKEEHGKELLYVAEKQYERGKKDGYREGFDEGYKKANEAMSFHYDNFHNSTPCYAPGGICTNPHFDCINCPKQSACHPATTNISGEK
jgi:flagellar biosynthesis/type III secretory pathway protein FliH